MIIHPRSTVAFTGLLFALGAVTAHSQARADYAMPPLEAGFNESITAIIDATVDRFDDKGIAHITVHKQLRGAFTPSTLFGVRYTCFGGTLKNFGVKEGHRYIFLLYKDEMFEENSRFEITSGKSWMLSVYFGETYRDWLGLPSAVMTRVDAMAALEKLSARYPSKPRP